MPTPAATAAREEEEVSDRARKHRRTPTERALDIAPGGGKPALRMAIAAKCFECQDTGDGTPTLIKARVRDCRAEKCPLWPHRGWQTSTVRLKDSPYYRGTPHLRAPGGQ